MSGLMKQCGIPQQKWPARLRPDINEIYKSRNVHGNVREQKCTWKCTRAEMYMEMYESRNVHGNVREQKCTWKCTRAEMYMEMYESRNVHGNVREQKCTWKCTDNFGNISLASFRKYFRNDHHQDPTNYFSSMIFRIYAWFLSYNQKNHRSRWHLSKRSPGMNGLIVYSSIYVNSI